MRRKPPEQREVRIVEPREERWPTIGGSCFGSKKFKVIVRNEEGTKLLVLNPGQTIYLNRWSGSRYHAAELLLISDDGRPCIGVPHKTLPLEGRFTDWSLAHPAVVAAVTEAFGRRAAEAMSVEHTVIVSQ